LPYTEVKLHVTEALRGQVGSAYTFRQFGLLKPRDMGNSKMNLMVAPAGWATYSADLEQGRGDDPLPAQTGSVDGLADDRWFGTGQVFKVAMASATNQAKNARLFKNVQINPTMLKTNEQLRLDSQLQLTGR